MRNLLIFTGMALALCASPLSGEVVTAVYSFTAGAASQGPYSEAAQITTFNSSLGTLTNVAMTLAYSGKVELAAGSATGPSPFTAAVASDKFSLSDAYGVIVPQFSENAGPLSGVAIPGAPSIIAPVNSFSGVAGPDNVAMGDIANFSGDGTSTVKVTLADSGATTTIPTFPLEFEGLSDIGGTLTVTYTYSSATPEPSTSCLVGSALLALGLFARTRGR